MADKISDAVERLMREGRDAREEERLEKRVKLVPAPRQTENQKTTQPELPAVAAPPPLSEGGKRMKTVNALWDKRLELLRKRPAVGDDRRRVHAQVQIKAKLESYVESGRLYSEAAKEPDPAKKEQLKAEAAQARMEAEVMEQQIQRLEERNDDEREIDDAIERIDDQLRALGVQVPAPTRRPAKPTDAELAAMTLHLGKEG